MAGIAIWLTIAVSVIGDVRAYVKWQTTIPRMDFFGGSSGPAPPDAQSDLLDESSLAHMAPAAGTAVSKVARPVQLRWFGVFRHVLTVARISHTPPSMGQLLCVGSIPGLFSNEKEARLAVSVDATIGWCVVQGHFFFGAPGSILTNPHDRCSQIRPNTEQDQIVNP